MEIPWGKLRWEEPWEIAPETRIMDGQETEVRWEGARGARMQRGPIEETVGNSLGRA